MTLRKGEHVIWERVYPLVLLGITLTFGLGLSAKVTEYVKDGLELAVRCVIPSSFPFMIVSDFYVSYGKPESIAALRKLFSSLFGISPYGLGAFICGNIGGFPIGAKMCADTYSAGGLSKEEAERLMPLSNNPSCAFVVGGVGMGIYGDLRVGILLLISMYIATVICGVITRTKAKKVELSHINANISYDFVASVRRSGINSIGIISFITVFSVFNGLVNMCIHHEPIAYAISAFLEVTNAIRMYSELSGTALELKLVFSAFALGFGGLCVGLQSAVFTSVAGLKMKRYYLTKLLEGVLTASVFSILYMI